MRYTNVKAPKTPAEAKQEIIKSRQEDIKKKTKNGWASYDFWNNCYKGIVLIKSPTKVEFIDPYEGIMFTVEKDEIASKRYARRVERENRSSGNYRKRRESMIIRTDSSSIFFETIDYRGQYFYEYLGERELSKREMGEHSTIMPTWVGMFKLGYRQNKLMLDYHKPDPRSNTDGEYTILMSYHSTRVVDVIPNDSNLGFKGEE